MVIWCVAFGTITSAAALMILSRGGEDPTGLLGVILAFFGGELALMFGRNALSGPGDKRKSTQDAISAEEKEAEDDA